MSNLSETFCRLLKGAINSIAAYEGKTAPAIEDELGAQIGVAGSTIQRYNADRASCCADPSRGCCASWLPRFGNWRTPKEFLGCFFSWACWPSDPVTLPTHGHSTRRAWPASRRLGILWAS